MLAVKCRRMYLDKIVGGVILASGATYYYKQLSICFKYTSKATG